MALNYNSIKKIKVFIVDSSFLRRKFIIDMFKKNSEVEINYLFIDIKECLQKLEEINYDLDCLIINIDIFEHEYIKLLNFKFKIIIIYGVYNIKVMKLKQLGYLENIKFIDGNSLYNDNCESIVKQKIYNEVMEIKFNRIRQFLFENHKAVVIASSTGGPKVLEYIFSKLKTKIDIPIFIVQHMPNGFTKQFVDRLNSISDYNIHEGVNGDIIKSNIVYVAPSGFHMEIDIKKRILLNQNEAINSVRPSADKLFHSASRVYKSGLLGIVLTGMGRDAAEGIVHIKTNGGRTIVQNEQTCSVFGMPKAAIDTGKVDKVLSIDRIIREILKFSNKI